MKSLIRTIIFFFLCLNVLAGLPTCPIYSDNLEKEECSKLEVNETKITLYIKACPKENEYCHYFFKSEVEKCSEDPPKRYPGEYCNDGKNCFSSKCDNDKKICKGQGDGEDCEKDYECDVGFFCFERKCKALLSKGETCDGTNKCKVNLICNKDKCTEYGSLDKDTEASAPAACKSYFIEGGKCQVGYKLESPRDACKENTCKYSQEGKDAPTKDCVCGVTEEGNSYCNLGEADVDPTPVLSNNLLVFRLCERNGWKLPYIIWSFVLV